MTTQPLTQRRIFWFWLPLAAMWILMAVEQPALAGVMARLSDPERNLAAFGLTFSLALFVEAPVIMLLTAGTALAQGPRSYRRLLHFTHAMALVLTGLHLLLALTPLYRLLLQKVIGAPEEVIELSRISFLLMTPWTSAIAYRRLWQGVLIRFERTQVVPVTIAARLAVSAGVLGVGLFLGRFPGAYVGAVALSLGVIAGAVSAYLYARPYIRSRLSGPAPAGDDLSYRELLRFYVPLALTSLITLTAQPLLATGLARGPEPLISLAVWPVVSSFLFLGMSIGLSFQEAVVALLQDRASYRELRRFTGRLALGLSGLFLLAAATPFAHWWYAEVYGLAPHLVGFAIRPTLILVAVPGLGVLISWQRGILIHFKRTQAITQSVVTSVLLLFLAMFGLMTLVHLPGALIAASALALSRLGEWGYLWWRSRPLEVVFRRPQAVSVAAD